MKYRIHVLISLIAIILAGCQAEPDTAIEPEKPKETVQEQEPSTEKYQSIREFQDTFNGENLKNDTLLISIEEDQLTLSMEIALTEELLSKIQNTANDFYYHFADLDGSDEISKALVELPEPVDGHLLIDSLDKDNNRMTVKQELTLKDDLTDNQLDFLKQPENYEFQTLDENKVPVHVIIGIDVSTFDTL
ncbi:hypothetical protein P4631_10430 [Halalkalibacterium halodurans]|uniref:BH0325 protein n=1 Tax=Halalkalibacterium halodurans (strain ATCC BAA-125 / DSM 18197 / FERM 7344 / JCM 9153 / C-125) TaxID=272558 RepID=Q9KFZ1_HALH5|nr:hypothetical protein [Halalkalibacterium halodurans]MED4172847.1 hypothetical protein [Halalkalibacterium halodurans]BAB04044.1 BH0325 [Halalkalibacterium halodurans C-125]